ncbi:MAG: DUF5665 domain-containing protein [Candidatus Levyibacteriota bacterium]
MAERYEQKETSFGKIIKNNFIGGIAWGIGATVGISVLVAILGFLLSARLDLIPIIGTFISDITSFVLENLQTNPRLLK